MSHGLKWSVSNMICPKLLDEGRRRVDGAPLKHWWEKNKTISWLYQTAFSCSINQFHRLERHAEDRSGRRYLNKCWTLFWKPKGSSNSFCAKTWFCKVREGESQDPKKDKRVGFASLWLSLVALSALFVHSLKASRKLQWNKINVHSYLQDKKWLDSCPTDPLSYLRKEKQVVSDAS